MDFETYNELLLDFADSFPEEVKKSLKIVYMEKVDDWFVISEKIEEDFKGYIVPIGGGKDSVVTLETLKVNKKVVYSFQSFILI